LFSLEIVVGQVVHHVHVCVFVQKKEKHSFELVEKTVHDHGAYRKEYIPRDFYENTYIFSYDEYQNPHANYYRYFKLHSGVILDCEN
jgi:hypothetical protein